MAPLESVDVLLSRWNEGFALLPLDSFALLVFENDGADRVCVDAGAADTTSMPATALHRADAPDL